MKKEAKKKPVKKGIIKVSSLFTEPVEKKIRERIQKKFKTVNAFCIQNGFKVSDLNRTLQMVPTPKTSLVVIAFEAEQIKIPETKKRKLLIGNERATRLKINREVIDEQSPRSA
ncbi:MULTISPECIES: hypothetical protein [Leptospira]|uniref:hypothetical protein n=1 Tax=Leptospira TaxID=171 RepID=UPI0002BE9A3D|nr:MULTISPECIES: hypothetical protein [Leptospira]EMK12911.1 hypothetical protein LEP1GSC066_1044 [Leptospira sp. serovar Kenya str. Sh9]